MNEKSQYQSPSVQLCSTLHEKSATETSHTELTISSNKLTYEQARIRGSRKTIHSPEQIADEFRYENGKIFYKKSRKGGRKKWATINDPAGRKTVNGYIVVSLNCQSYYAHRVVWCLHHGYWPNEQIDHINGIRDDNRIENLRSVTAREHRTFLKKSNTSGVVGVSWEKASNKWRAEIKINGKNIVLGYFYDKSLATTVRKNAEKQRGY